MPRPLWPFDSHLLPLIAVLALSFASLRPLGFFAWGLFVADCWHSGRSWPVTPYTVKVFNHTGSAAWVKLEIDGVQTNNKRHSTHGNVVQPGGSRVFEGFELDDGTREFLFSLPRFAKDETDRLDKSRHKDVGIIKVTTWSADFVSWSIVPPDQSPPWACAVPSVHRMAMLSLWR